MAGRRSQQGRRSNHDRLFATAVTRGSRVSVGARLWIPARAQQLRSAIEVRLEKRGSARQRHEDEPEQRGTRLLVCTLGHFARLAGAFFALGVAFCFVQICCS